MDHIIAVAVIIGIVIFACATVVLGDKGMNTQVNSIAGKANTQLTELNNSIK